MRHEPKETLFSSHCTPGSHGTTRARASVLKVAVGGQDLAVAVMVIPCLTVGEGVRLLADCGERDVVEEEPPGGLQLLLAQLARQVVIAVRLRALLCALRTCR